MQESDKNKQSTDKTPEKKPSNEIVVNPPENQSKSKEIDKSDKKGRIKYTEEEDRKILEYVKGKPADGLTSRKFWENAVQVDHLLDNTRSSDSLRERYRMHLDPELKKEGGKASAGKSSKKKATDEDSSDGDHTPRKSSKKRQGSTKKKEADELSDTPSFGKSKKKSKRKDYEGMDKVDKLLKKKSPVVLPDPTHIMKPTLLTHEEEELVEEKKHWVEEQAKKHNMSEEKFMDLFHRCSMDTHILQRYFKGDTHLLWDDDEDMLLRGPAKKVGKKVLAAYKEASNVKLRVKYLKSLDQLRPTFSLVSVVGNV